MDGFWVNFWSNLWSDLIVGGILGFVLALWLNKIQQKDADRAEEEKKAEESQKRKRKILELLKNELEINANYLHGYSLEPVIDNNTLLDSTVYLSHGLKSENWRAFSDGGELQWINDVELLSSLAITYHQIQTVKEIAKLFLKYSFFEKPFYGETAGERLKFQLEADISVAKQYIEDAIERIGTN